MVPIMLIGSSEDREISEYLRSFLNEHGGVFFVTKDKIFGTSAAKYMVFEFEEIPETFGIAGIVIFKEKSAGYSGNLLPEGLVGVVDSGHTGALALLKKSGIPTISCGMSVHDTLTLSSISDTSATVTLSRDIVNLQKEVREPQDIPLKLVCPARDYSIMAGAAVLLLS